MDLLWSIFASYHPAFDHENTVRYANVARDYLRRGEVEESLFWFSKAIRGAPWKADLYLARSEAWQRISEDDLALADASLGILLRPRLSAGYARLAAAFMAQGQFRHAARAGFLGTQCGDPNFPPSTYSSLMSRAAQAGVMTTFVWKPLNRWPRATWTLLSIKGTLMGAIAHLLGVFLPAGAPIVLSILGSPWPLFEGFPRLLVRAGPGDAVPSFYAAPICTSRSGFICWTS